MKSVGSPKINIKGDKDYDPTRPEGALLYKRIHGEYTDPRTGKTRIINEYTDPKTGKTRVRTEKSTRMAETDDARTLISDANSSIEILYADYANKMKSLANRARKESVTTKGLVYSPTARKLYDKEYKDLDAKLKLSELNAPKERKAQMIANSVCKAKFKAYPDLTKSEKKKIGQQELDRARAKVGAKREHIEITPREWEAIQAGAVSDTQLKRIIKYVPSEKLKSLALPREKQVISDAKAQSMKSMRALGYTNREIADRFGVSTTTVSKAINGKLDEQS